MDNRKILDEVYRDFFGTVKEEKITPIDKEIEIKNIEELLIDEDSKELLKKIITYIKNYNNGVYIKFNILLYGNNKETLNAIINLLKSVLFPTFGRPTIAITGFPMVLMPPLCVNGQLILCK